MRTVRLALVLLLSFSGTSVSAQSDVSLLDAWVVDGSYATQDATFNVSTGTDRLVLVALSAEKNQNGPISVASVSLGDQVLTEVFDFTVGGPSAYHNLNWLGYLPESQISARIGSDLTITYANSPSNPFDQPKIHYASYEHVDQVTPIADSSNNSNTSTSSLQLSSALTASDGDRIVGFNVLGQHYNPGLTTAGYSEVTQSIGANNGHASAVYDRPVTTGVTENPTFTTATGTRMAVSAVVLKRAGIDVTDVDPPSPDPMTWATEPYSTGSSSISMTATTASDANSVQYYFTNTGGGGNDSIWQGSTTYEDTGLLPNTSYSYTVMARDTSANENTTLVSVQRSALTEIIDLSPDVSLLDAWVVDGSYATQNATFNVSAGTDRLVLVALSAEKNQNGPISVASVSLGDQVLTEVFDFTVGGQSAYHNLNWLGYLPESQISSRIGSDLTITYANSPSNPFDQPKIHFASYEHVDQVTPIVDSSNNSNTSTSSLQLSSALTASDGDRIVGFNVLGQHYNPGLTTAGYSEVTQSIGANNGHASAVYDRPVTTSLSENPTFTTATGTRMAVSAVVLKAAEAAGDPPVITSNGGGASAGVSVPENTSAVTTVAATDPDTPQGNLTYSISGGDDQSAFSIGSSTGVLTFNISPDFENRADANADNDYQVTVTVNDGANTDSQNLTVTVTNVNEAPVSDDQSISTNEDTPFAITLTGSDPEGTSLSFAAGNPSNGSLSGTAPNLTYTPAADFSGSDSFTFTASDGSLTSSSATISITVVAVNDDPPVITSNGGGASAGVSVPENTSAVTTVTATDPDTPQGNLTYSLSGGADQSAFSIGSTTGILTFNISPDFENRADANADNNYQVTVTVNDGANSDSQNLTVTVTNVNEAPTANSQSVTTDEDTPIAITLTGSDPEGTSLSFAAGNPSNGSLNGTAPNLTYTPAGNFNGNDSFMFVANDGSVDSSPATVSISVTPVNDDPVANDDDFTSTPVSEGGTLAGLNVLGNDGDVDGSLDATSVTITGQSNGVATPNGDGTVNFDHDGSSTSVASFSYTVDDSQGATSNEATVSLSVTSVVAITLDANFDSASIGSHSINGNVIDITLRTDQISNNSDDYTYWANFKLSNVAGQEVTLNFTNASAVPFLSQPGSNENQMVYSCDGANWNRFTQHTYSGGTYTVTQTFACNDVQIATYFPFSYERMQNFIDTVAQSQWATQTRLGSSLLGRDVDLLTITDTNVSASSKRHIYIVGRQHAAETSSSHMLEGLMDFLILDIPDAQVIRQNFVFYIVPIANPDGVSLGNSRATSELRDPNRDWSNNNSDAINIIRTHLDSISGAPDGVDLFIDWHSQMNDLRWSNFVYSPPTTQGNNFFTILSQMTDFDEQEAVGTSCGSGCTARGHATLELGLFTFVVEPTPHLVTWTVNSLQQHGISMAYVIAEYFGVSLDVDPPTPDKMTWVIPPTATGTSSITMEASPASHSNDVEYFFDNIGGGGNDSGWQPSNVYEDTGLDPDTEYTYTVVARDLVNRNQNNASDPASATTDSVVGPPETVRIAAIGDFGNGSSNAAAVGSLIATENADSVIALGDARYNGGGDFDRAVGQFYCDYLADAGSGAFCSGGNSATNRFFVAPGNHDYTDGAGINEYLAYFTLPGTGIATSNTSGTELYYDYIDGPVHVFVIDSQAATTNSSSEATQRAWLQAQLAASTSPWQIVAMHHAPLSSSSLHGSDPTMSQWPYASWGVDAVLGGHDHTYERIDRDGIPYFVSGLGGQTPYGFGTPIAGSQVRYNSEFGALFIDASASVMSFEFINTSGTTIDSFSVVVDPSRPTPNPMTWATAPTATGTSSISMTASTASHVNGVQYYFTNTAGNCNDSGWQPGNTYENTGLLPGTTCTYSVKAREQVNQNETSASIELSATTDNVGGTTDVTLLNSWVVDGSYATQNATFNVSAGTDRLVLVALSAEKNQNGPVSVSSVRLGDQVLTEVFDFTVGNPGAYHDVHWLGYLLESQIAARSGSGLTIQYSNAPSNPFDQPKIHYASYEHVDQATPIADSSSAANTSTSSLQLSSAITASDGDRIVGFNVLGQHYNPGVTTAGYTEVTQSIGANNGHSSGVYDRPVTANTTENPTFTTSTGTRMAVSAVVLKAASAP